MKVTTEQIGRGHKIANSIGVGINYGHFIDPELDEARKALCLSIGLWCVAVRVWLWRERL